MSHLFHTSLMYTFNLWRIVIAPRKNVWDEDTLVNARDRNKRPSLPSERPSFCTHLPDLLANDGEHPEVEHILSDGRTSGRLPLEVHQQHVGKQQEEEEVHENVAQKWGHGCKPELSPPWYDEGPLGWPLRLRDACGGRTVGDHVVDYHRKAAVFKSREADDSPLMVAPLGELEPWASASLRRHSFT